MCRNTVSRLALLLLCYVGLPKIKALKALKAPTITSKIKALNTPTNTSSGDRGWSGAPNHAPMEKMKVDTKRTVKKNVDTKRAARKTVRKNPRRGERVEGAEVERYMAELIRSNELHRIEALELLASPKGSDGFTTHFTFYTLQKYKY
jgi:hypothetical protein